MIFIKEVRLPDNSEHTIYKVNRSKSVKILILRWKVREKIRKKSVIFADFDFIFFLFFTDIKSKKKSRSLKLSDK